MDDEKGTGGNSSLCGNVDPCRNRESGFVAANREHFAVLSLTGDSTQVPRPRNDSNGGCYDS